MATIPNNMAIHTRKPIFVAWKLDWIKYV